MQYLLTSEEMAALAPRVELELWKKNCMKLAQRLAQTRVPKEPKDPYACSSGCILLPHCVSQYCTGCPAFDLCPVTMKQIAPTP